MASSQRQRQFSWVISLGLLAVTCQPASTAEPQQLTRDGQLKFSPTFINGGRKLVFSAHNQPKRVSIIELDLATGKQSLHYPVGSDSQFDIAVSRDGTFECFARSGGIRQLSLVIRNLVTKKETLFHPPGALRSTIRTPRFTPDNKRIVMTINAPGGQQIISMNLQGKDVRKLTASNGINGWADISPDGRTIVFSSSRNGALDLWLMDANGENQRQLIHSARRDIYPTWSPDGQRIAFTSARDGNQEIYIVDRDGNNLRRLTRHPERDSFPVWHPDGQRLLTISERRGRFDFYLWDVSTTAALDTP
ncbi:MAG TPA: hypothetical protein DIC23_08995 [Planctomycetaceae bacterium]|nr:hypothetical protein [Planctomycetaceae bacterium]